MINTFVENGHSRKSLEDIAMSYKPPPVGQTSTQEEASSKEAVITLPWIPRLGPRLRTVFKRHGKKVVFSSGVSLKTILCSKNKSKLPMNSQPGVYKLDCTCGSSYVGETKKHVSTRVREHQRDVFNGNWEPSGATHHSKTCEGTFNWDADVTIAVENNFRRRKVRESLEIRRHQATLNRDRGRHDAGSWDAFFYKLDRAVVNNS